MIKNAPIYHITHIDNISAIITEGKLWSDSQRISKDLNSTNIGHQHIKQKRLKREVELAAKGNLGDYVPFYFCNRSIMLYTLNQGAVLGYSSGQSPVIHLVSSIQSAIETGNPWAFTDIHAALAYANYYDDLNYLDRINWDVMNMEYWSEVKEERQAEFLVYDSFPWKSVEKIGVLNQEIADKVLELIKDSPHKPDVKVERSWYY